MTRKKGPIPEPAAPADVDLYMPAEVDQLTQALQVARRDALGFIEGDTPSLSGDQVRWLSRRMQLENDEDTTEALQMDPEMVLGWRTSPEFLAVYQISTRNKREAFRLLTTNLLGTAIERIVFLMEHGNPQAIRAGVTLLLRVQGLLIDKISTDQGDQVQQLFDLLRVPAPTQVIRHEDVVPWHPN